MPIANDLGAKDILENDIEACDDVICNTVIVQSIDLLKADTTLLIEALPSGITVLDKPSVNAYKWRSQRIYLTN